MAYNTAYDLAGFMVNTKAAAVYAAQEASLFLGGLTIPQIQVPAGSITAQLPLLGSVTAQKLTSASHNVDDFDALGITSTNKTITANIYAARDVVRDLGGIDPNELGRVLGNSVSAAFDKDVVAAFSGLTASADTGTLTLNAIFDAVAQIRGAGETGQLYGVLGTAAAAELMKVIGSTAYAGGAMGLKLNLLAAEKIRISPFGEYKIHYNRNTHPGLYFGIDVGYRITKKDEDLESDWIE